VINSPSGAAVTSGVMPRARAVLLVLAVVGGLFGGISSPASAGVSPPCDPGETEVRGRVRDAATGLPLSETTSVGVVGVAGTVYDDGIGTDAASRWATCLAAGTYTFGFSADSYRVEWYDDQPSQPSATHVEVSGAEPIIVNESLVPRGRVIAGRVTNMGGVPKFASIGIFRRNAAGNWVGIDGIGNHEATGWYSFRVPSHGRYRVNACVDSHWCQWATSENRLRHARVVVVAPGDPSTFVNDVHIRVPYCHAAPDFCVPPGFNS
jgi:hypothetical protein